MEKIGPNIKYVLIGHVLTGKHLMELLILQKNEKTRNESNKIFESVSKLKETSYEQRNKIGSGETSYYFIIKKDQNGPLFFLVEAKTNYPERLAFEFIDEILNQNLVSVNFTESSMRVSIGLLLEKYQKSIILDSVMSDVNDIKLDIGKSIQSQLKNIDSLNELKDRSDNIKLGAEVYKKDAKQLKCQTWCQNCKWTIIIILAIVFLILIIVLPIVLSKK